jgi:hypothetical protein
MRGRTLNDAFVILDEAQNTTPEQMKMFLTRLGFDSKAVVTGDVTQIDLPPDKRSGLVEAVEILRGVEGIGSCRSTSATWFGIRSCSRSCAPTSGAREERARRRGIRGRMTVRLSGRRGDSIAGACDRAACACCARSAGAAELSIALVDDATIAELNARYRGVSGATDVLSFSLRRGRARGAARRAARRRRRERRHRCGAGAARGASLDDEVLRLLDPRHAAPARPRPRARRRGARMRAEERRVGRRLRRDPRARARCGGGDGRVAVRAFPHPIAGRVIDLGGSSPGSRPRASCSRSRARAARARRARGSCVHWAAYSAILHWIYVVTVTYGHAHPAIGVVAPIALASYIALFGGAVRLELGVARRARARLAVERRARVGRARPRALVRALRLPVGGARLCAAHESRRCWARVVHGRLRALVRERARQRGAARRG